MVKQSAEYYRQWATRNPEKVAAKRLRRYERVRLDREARSLAELEQLRTEGCRAVVGFPAYLVSPRGEVFSTFGRRVIELKPGIKPGGYEFVGLHADGICQYQMIHRVVATAFIPNPERFPEVNHKDGNKRLNHVENLEWCSRVQNASHAVSLGLIKSGAQHHNSKLTEEQVREIRAASGSLKEIGTRFGLCAQGILNIKRCKAYCNVI